MPWLVGCLFVLVRGRDTSWEKLFRSLGEGLMGAVFGTCNSSTSCDRLLGVLGLGACSTSWPLFIACVLHHAIVNFVYYILWTYLGDEIEP
jgi:hypothetical protein